ncbi:MAG: hypothetical protein AB8U88_02925 [Rickettsia conorii subsp. raoultii]|uniref:Uncharacterized protein n=6 Tax=spotted fever group TaxID=114277 RepID=A0A9N7B5P6_RICCR|nr:MULTISPECIES: hypothetical protein [spotted fever group]AAL03851.1 unknown [Rickettsia conorii str. Malish 7]AFC69089.1 hypothetical protein MCE_00160 [Rickettsia amblyommatis str. GAT-30V]AFC75460.1 hypothetical protein MC1_07250 [Rickettsia parkeri str. Portsmouth]AJQ52284.1 hypothetical protein UQ52_06980 [Rickettsia conorii subsp. raoultii]APZ30551.1 hypothetical protein RRIM16_07510 [Rickettsia conorii subsp. raoultii]
MKIIKIPKTKNYLKIDIITLEPEYYKNKFGNNIFREFTELKKRAPLGSVDEILEMKNFGRK